MGLLVLAGASDRLSRRRARQYPLRSGPVIRCKQVLAIVTGATGGQLARINEKFNAAGGSWLPLMSAYALDSEREKAIASGCDEFDAKPIEFEALVRHHSAP